MNNDLISREDLSNAIDTIKQTGYDSDGEPLFDYVELTDLIKVIYNAPPIEYTFEEAFQKTVCEQKLYCPERPHGKWKDLSDGWQEGTYECSNCKSEFVLTEGTPEDNEYHYCPNCGAKMDLKEAEEC